MKWSMQKGQHGRVFRSWCLRANCRSMTRCRRWHTAARSFTLPWPRDPRHFNFSREMIATESVYHLRQRTLRRPKSSRSPKQMLLSPLTHPWNFRRGGLGRQWMAKAYVSGLTRENAAVVSLADMPMFAHSEQQGEPCGGAHPASRHKSSPHWPEPGFTPAPLREQFASNSSVSPLATPAMLDMSEVETSYMSTSVPLQPEPPELCKPRFLWKHKER